MAKNIVFLADGTWTRPSHRDRGVEAPTNVWKTAERLLNDGEHQLVMYDEGVGTGGLADRLTGGVFGRGLSANVKQGYRFICDHYEKRDRIFLFGFSRGAYTVRSLGGLIYASGILEDPSDPLVERAFELYRDPEIEPDDDEAESFREQHSLGQSLHFIGVWDTVGRLGLPYPRLNRLIGVKPFPDVKLNPLVKHAYHALAVDEDRRAFAPTLWETSRPAARQRLEQVWFAGTHSNVGGGYADAGLSDLALGWMLAKAEDAGIELKEAAPDAKLEPNLLGELRSERRGIKRLLFRKGPREIRTAREDEPKASLYYSVKRRILTIRRPLYRPRNLPWNNLRRLQWAYEEVPPV